MKKAPIDRKFTRRGVSYKIIVSRRSRWGGPKLHLGHWNRATHNYEAVCRDPGSFGDGWREATEPEDANLPRCLRCVAYAERSW